MNLTNDVPSQSTGSDHKEQRDIRDYFHPLAVVSTPDLSHGSDPSRHRHVQIVGSNFLQYDEEPFQQDLDSNCPDTQRAHDLILNSQVQDLPSLACRCEKSRPSRSKPRSNHFGSLRPMTMIDDSMMPKPLNLKVMTDLDTEKPQQRDHDVKSTTPDDSVIMSAAIDTEGSFSRSRIMSIFEKQSLGSNHLYSEIALQPMIKNRNCRLQDVEALTGTKQPRNPDTDEVIIYFLPSTSPASAPPETRGKGHKTDRISDRQIPKHFPRSQSVDESAEMARHKRLVGQGASLKDSAHDSFGGLPFHKPLPSLSRAMEEERSQMWESAHPKWSTSVQLCSKHMRSSQEHHRPTHRRTQSESAASGTPHKKKEKGGKLTRLMKKYVAQMEDV